MHSRPKRGRPLPKSRSPGCWRKSRGSSRSLARRSCIASKKISERRTSSLHPKTSGPSKPPRRPSRCREPDIPRLTSGWWAGGGETPDMKARSLIVAAIAALGVSGAHAGQNGAAAPSDRQKLIGAWHMVSMEEQAADGKVTHHTDRSGMLVYSADGHVSVQVMYPESGSAASANPVYAKGGYEASFGSFELDEQAHTVTHHVQASLV